MIAKVAVSAVPYAVDKPFDYLVPPNMTALCGARVMVPFGRGNRRCEGIVLSCGTGDIQPGLKSVDQVLDETSVLSGKMLALALWMHHRYFCTVYDAARLMIPAGLTMRHQESWRRTKRTGDIPENCRALYETLSGEALPLDGLIDRFGPETRTLLNRLETLGLAEAVLMGRAKAAPGRRLVASLAISAREALDLAERKKSRSEGQAAVLRFLAAAGTVPTADVTYYTGARLPTLRALEKQGALCISETEALRIPDLDALKSPSPVTLNSEQERTRCAVREKLGSGSADTFLLCGVTGSGKTQVYLKLVQDALDRGLGAMVLVPEIVLTPQMLRQFAMRFGDQVALLHSGLRITERYDQWERLRSGRARVVLGTRSAVFAPVQKLGLIILDEEQDASYRSQSAPLYDAREIARYLAIREKAVLLLGSATPSIESFYHARQGRFELCEIRTRFNRGALPEVVIADLKEDIKAGNAGTIGAVLREELAKNIKKGEQSILFLNRRGNSKMLLCGECGTSPGCPNCSAPLTYHSANDRLMCHHCGYSRRADTRCPVCGGVMRRVGSGTQKVEEELHELFPHAAVLRMDADTATAGHEKLLARFREERIPILLGTQMVTKGLDFENVTLVGVLSADLSLYVDSYRASERTFDLLAQVTGRAGRGSKPGRAVIQTLAPGNDVIRLAAAQDYLSFYEQEIRLREARGLPPFHDLYLLTVSGVDEGQVLRGCSALFRALKFAFQGVGEVFGPSPAPILRINERYRYRCILNIGRFRDTRERLRSILLRFYEEKENRGLALGLECNPED